MKIHILKPNFNIYHFKTNLFRRNNGKIDIMCLIHALTFNILFFERLGEKHKKANKTHLKRKLNE